MKWFAPIVVWTTLWCTSAVAAPWSPDLNCDGETNVADVMLSILIALDLPVSEQLDADQDGVPDACESQPVSDTVCGYGTILSVDGTQCVVSQALLDETFEAGVETGAVSPPEYLTCSCEDATYGDVSWDPTFLVWEGSCAPWSSCAPGSAATSMNELPGSNFTFFTTPTG